MKYVGTDELEPGMILASTLYDNQERILLSANQKLTRIIINRIKLLHFDGIYIFDDETEEPHAHLPVISDETRVRALRELKRLNIRSCTDMANQMVQEIIEDNAKIIEMINLSSYENYIYEHSLNVTLISVIIGIAMEYTAEELRKLAQAALLHDIGTFKIDNRILDKPGKLTKEEFAVMKHHPQYGYEMMWDKDIDLDVKMAIYSHHENEDGSGYPRGVTGSQIPKFAKVIHVADVYDALTARRVFREAINPLDALEYLMGNLDTMFDRDVVMTFCKHVAPYPIGSSVLLSNGETATIFENHEDFLSRPIVKLESGEELDLINTLNITIVGLVRK